MNEEWAAECQPDLISESDALAGLNMCSVACGQCFLLSGVHSNYSTIWIVNEIADVNAVGFHLLGCAVTSCRPKWYWTKLSPGH